MCDKKDWLFTYQEDKKIINKLKKKLKKIISNIEPEKLEEQINFSGGRKGYLTPRGNITQWSLKDSLDEEFYNYIKNQIIKKCSSEIEYKDFDLILTNSWTIIGKKNSYHVVHQHSKYYMEDRISVVVYLETPTSNHNLPGTFYAMLKEDSGIKYIRKKSIIPSVGTVIVMPAYLWHGALPAAGKRQTLNFEFIIEDKTDYTSI
mgnify:CR=1 FL=1